MSILSAYKQLKRQAIKQNSEFFLCNIADSLYGDDKITGDEHDAIISDIQNHIGSVTGDSYKTMFSCVKSDILLPYDNKVAHASKYRLKWLELQIVRYSLTP